MHLDLRLLLHLGVYSKHLMRMTRLPHLSQHHQLQRLESFSNRGGLRP